MPAILDVAIGTLFVFLLFSLIVSALNEYILSLTDQRAKFLHLGLAELFGKGVAGPKGRAWWGQCFTSLGGLLGGGKEDLGTYGNDLLKHGLINAFSRSDNGGTSPSYLPAGAFVTGLLDVIVIKAGVPAAAWSQADADVLTSFITAIQSQKTAAGAGVISPADYTTALASFAPAAPPAAGTMLAEFQTKVDAARQKPTAQAALLAATDLATAGALIPAQDAALRAELTDLAQRADDSFDRFKLLLTQWFTTNSELERLQGAATAALAQMLVPQVAPTAEAIAAGIEKIADGKLKDSLQSLYRAVDGDVRNFKLAVEGWFNGVMDRVSGWYKRFAQKWMIVLGLLLAAIFNVDTIEIVRVLSNNPALAKAVADQAATYVSHQGKPLTTNELEARRQENLEAVKSAEAALEAANRAEEKDPAKLKKLTDAVGQAHADADTLAAYQNAVEKLFATGIPIGWTPEARKKLGLRVGGEPPAPSTGPPGAASGNKSGLKGDVLLGMIAGWFLTAIAASLGAPFWFDMLGRFVNVRAAGKAPGEKETTSTPTRPAPANIDTTPGTHPPAK